MAESRTQSSLGPRDEFERQPVPERAWLGFGSFLGMYAAEHLAGTELMIGPLFLAAGVSAFDLIVGLLVGNLLAVLCWTFLTAPIATRARLTLYYQLEKICGRDLVLLYNLANGVMFCFVAGAMVTVSATAVGVWIKFPMPRLFDLYPNSLGWVITVLVVGTAISLVAASGYETVARIANYAAPWKTLLFVAFGIIALRELHVTSLDQFWYAAKHRIWTGGAPMPGQTKFTLWHVIFFTWFCNLAMHVGMADLSILRFARKSWYGVASAAGMYLGHGMAWISASLLYAAQLDANSSNIDVLPGPMTYKAAGLAGLLCVVIAGWTTANPTIYRAGLAFQAIVPRWSRFRVTLVTGMVATVAGMFPALVMRYMDFSALYGLLLIPMGAVILVDFYLLRRVGLLPNYAEAASIRFNWAAALSWFVALGLCSGLLWYFQIDVFFVALPGWFFAAILYLLLSKVYQRKSLVTSAVGTR